jgi:hypothetical protein
VELNEGACDVIKRIDIYKEGSRRKREKEVTSLVIVSNKEGRSYEREKRISK